MKIFLFLILVFSPSFVFADQIIKDKKFSPYTRYVDSNNLRIFALERVSDNFLIDVASIYGSMFNDNNMIDPVMQKTYLKSLKKNYVYQRIGIIGPDDNPGFDCCPRSGRYQDNHTDFIWENADGNGTQANEIIEHLLHTITAVGFYYAFPDEWRWDKKKSPLILAMQEAIEKGIFDVSSYKEIRDKKDYLKITAQEFAYWMIIAEWNYFDLLIKDPYHPEFSVRSQSEMIKKLPLAHTLYMDTAAKIMIAPDKFLLKKY